MKDRVPCGVESTIFSSNINRFSPYYFDILFFNQTI